MFRATKCPSSGENYCIYVTLVFGTLYGWCLVGWLDLKHVLGIKVPIIRRKSLYLFHNGICHSVWVASGRLFGFKTCFGHQSAHHQEKSLYLCDTGICHSVWVASGRLVGFKTCFGHQSAHHQEKVTVSMRHWYLSLWMGGVWSAGWI